ncbi:hypothetical protein Bpfe_003878 [Biomphalaria pfeifferi]|uniref:HAT C-terminal dimerisation domain-containing protein n=1 Tax=Biomphalaria pfeifferi TaxID=112525 RepID=A0AAD8C4Q3_BIOPF|nr:hypothetical protein Bpfe_003878 [Biomphalaria pfeifferi]
MSEVRSSERRIRKRKHGQCFREEWLEDPEFMDWLQQDPLDSSSSYCTCCKSHLKHADRSMLMAHKQTMKHTNAMAGIPVPTPKNIEKKMQEAENQAISELLIACYFTEHRLPYHHVDDLTAICKSAFPDCKIARKLALRKTKLACLVQDGIAYHEKEELAEICRTQKFSIMIDENIDMSVGNLIAVVVRFFDIQKLDIVDVLFDTISPDNGTSEDIYNAVKMLFLNKNIPLENIIGFGSDNCLNGVYSLLKAEVPTVFGIGCDCHSFSLCFNYAIKMLPSYFETFLHDIATYFVNKGKQLTDFGVNVDIVNSLQDKVQELSSTRWLSYENIINVILDQWNVLINYFQIDSKTDNVDTSLQIYSTMLTRGTKHMLLFLQYILQKVNTFNTEFQSDEFRLHLLHSLISQSYRDVLSCFIDDEVIVKHKLSEIDPCDLNIHKKHDDIFLGGKAMALLYQEPLNEDTEQFLTSCLQFLIELSSQIKQNFPIQETGIVAKLSVLDPQIVQSFKKSSTAITKLATHFTNLIHPDQIKDLLIQWKALRASKEASRQSTSIPQYWYMLRHIKDSAGVLKYDIVSDLMTNLSVLPHSSTAAEKIFSQINMIKIKYPSPLKSEAVKDRLIARQMLVRKNVTCCTWEPGKELIKDAVGGACHKRFQMRLELYRALSGDDNLDIEEFESD